MDGPNMWEGDASEDPAEAAEMERKADRHEGAAKRLAEIAREELAQGEVDLGWWIGREALAMFANAARRFAELDRRERVIGCWAGYARLATRFSAARHATGTQAQHAERGRIALANWRDGTSSDGPAESRATAIDVDAVPRERDFLESHPCRCGGHWVFEVQALLERTDTPDGYLMHDELRVRCDFCAVPRRFYFRVRYELEGREREAPSDTPIPY